MANNLNVNAIPYKCNSGEEFREDPPADMVPFHKEITVSKTEVKEEVYDFEMSVHDTEFVDVKEENTYGQNNFEGENLEVIKSREQALNENLDVWNCELGEANLLRNKYRCELCQADFDDEMYLRRHYEHCAFTEQKLSKEYAYLSHNVGKRYECAHCTFLTYDRKYFLKHAYIHAKNNPFKCTYKKCKCIPGQANPCECDPCGYATIAKNLLNQHILVSHSAEPKQYKCTDCTYATHTKASLVNHIRTHTNDRPFKCTYQKCECIPIQKECFKCKTCTYAVKTKNLLEAHILQKHSAEPKKYKCRDCKYATHTKAHLVKHMRTHRMDRPFKCTYKDCECTPSQKESCNCNTCTYAAKNRSVLKTHILQKHSTEPKNYKCRDCNYVSHIKASLVVHIRTHTSEKPFKCTHKNVNCTHGQQQACECDMCGYAATDKGTLQRHVLEKHSAEPKKFKCTDCQYATHRKTSLVRHSRTHTNGISVQT